MGIWVVFLLMCWGRVRGGVGRWRKVRTGVYISGKRELGPRLTYWGLCREVVRCAKGVSKR